MKQDKSINNNMSSKIFSGAVVGLETQIIEVESDISYGLRSFEIVGLPDKAVEESTVITKHSKCS
ncbi:hypothetical protein KJ562_00350 [Patescibacteria group bacterium]|nr:hypothetical protein [Patescibacteria group bacterium]MBU4162070.1 hypothetical protein [Patescibacteria group bacterium]